MFIKQASTNTEVISHTKNHQTQRDNYSSRGYKQRIATSIVSFSRKTQTNKTIKL